MTTCRRCGLDSHASRMVEALQQSGCEACVSYRKAFMAKEEQLKQAREPHREGSNKVYRLPLVDISYPFDIVTARSSVYDLFKDHNRA